MKDIIYKIASRFNFDKHELYSRYKYEKKNKLFIFETSKSNLDEYKNANNSQSFFGLALCVGNKNKVLNNVVLKIDDEYDKVFKEFGLSSNDRQILYLILISNIKNEDITSDKYIKNYILNIPDCGLICSICKAPVNFETKQVRSADEGDKTFAICSKNKNHIFSTDRYTLDSENIDTSKEVNILLDR